MSGTLGTVTLGTWLLTACIGGYMLAAVIRDGPRQGRSGRPPAVLIGHFCLALSGLLAWILFVAAGWAALAWTALGLLMPAIGLGVSTVTIWTPFPGPRHRPGEQAEPGPGTEPGAQAAPGPGAEPGPLPRPDPQADLASALADPARTEQLIDELLAGLLAGPQRQSRWPRLPVRTLIPAGHGIAAGITFVLAVLTVAGTR